MTRRMQGFHVSLSFAQRCLVMLGASVHFRVTEGDGWRAFTTTVWFLEKVENFTVETWYVRKGKLEQAKKAVAHG